MALLLRLLFVLIAVVVTAAPALAQPVVSAVRTGVHPDKTRLVLDLNEAVEFSVFTLADPYRVVVDLPEVGWAPGAAQGGRRGLVSSLRFGLFAPGNSRVVLDVTGPVAVKQTMLLPPTNKDHYRLVVDLVGTDRESFLAAIRPPVRRAAAPVVPAIKPERRSAERIVVIDPGHGGVDPGAIGVGGTYEKDVVLEYARELKRRIEAKGGFKVLLTRDRDVFIALGDRVKFARQAGAELFVSLHADSIDDHSIRGGAVYTLSETASDGEAAALAAKENKSDIIAGVDLGIEDEEVASILIDLVQRETMNYSARFANIAVEELAAQKLRIRNRPHRFAGFRVLKAPDVPSVLVELGYLSNRKEERYLRSKEGRAAITDALADVIVRYFAEIKA